MMRLFHAPTKLQSEICISENWVQVDVCDLSSALLDLFEIRM